MNHPKFDTETLINRIELETGRSYLFNSTMLRNLIDHVASVSVEIERGKCAEVAKELNAHNVAAAILQRGMRGAK